MSDDVHSKATRVENVIEKTLDPEKGTQALQNELAGLSGPDKLALMQDLQKQNQAAHDADWRLPHVEFEQKTEGGFLGIGSHNVDDIKDGAKVAEGPMEWVGVGVRKALNELNEANPIVKALTPKDQS